MIDDFVSTLVFSSEVLCRKFVSLTAASVAAPIGIITNKQLWNPMRNRTEQKAQFVSMGILGMVSHPASLINS